MKTLLSILFLLNIQFALGQKNKLVINFDFNSNIIKEENVIILKAFITENKVDITLCGHTDSKGSVAYNVMLSQKRIDAVKAFLVANGFANHFIKNEKAYGKSQLILQNDEDKEKAIVNRRVEIIYFKAEPELIAKIDSTKNKQPKTNNIKEKLADVKMTIGSSLVLKNLQFIGGTHILLQTSMPELNELLEALMNNIRIKISIEGHICCQPGDEDGLDSYTYTKDLSVQRAKAIYTYLIQNGIEKSRLYYKGFGHSAPIYPYPEKTNVEQMENRRVEIKILDK